jgi:predicted nucleic acid-binding protein
MSDEFVDTNVLVYANDAAAGGKYYIASELVERLSLERRGVLSSQVLAELYSIVTRKLRIPAAEAENILESLGHWPLHQPAHADLIRASRLHRRFQVQWWDALLINSAIELGCTTLWSEDLNHGQQYGPVTVRNPFA